MRETGPKSTSPEKQRIVKLIKQCMPDLLLSKNEEATRAANVIAQALNALKDHYSVNSWPHGYSVPKTLKFVGNVFVGGRFSEAKTIMSKYIAWPETPAVFLNMLENFLKNGTLNTGYTASETKTESTTSNDNKETNNRHGKGDEKKDDDINTGRGNNNDEQKERRDDFEIIRLKILLPIFRGMTKSRELGYLDPKMIIEEIENNLTNANINSIKLKELLLENHVKLYLFVLELIEAEEGFISMNMYQIIMKSVDRFGLFNSRSLDINSPIKQLAKRIIYDLCDKGYYPEEIFKMFDGCCPFNLTDISFYCRNHENIKNSSTGFNRDNVGEMKRPTVDDVRNIILNNLIQTFHSRGEESVVLIERLKRSVEKQFSLNEFRTVAAINSSSSVSFFEMYFNSIRSIDLDSFYSLIRVVEYFRLFSHRNIDERSKILKFARMVIRGNENKLEAKYIANILNIK